MVAIIFTGACVSTPPTTAAQPAMQPTVTPDIPTLQSTFTATVTPQPSNWIALEPPHTVTPVILPDSEIPVFPGARDVRRNYTDLLTEQTGNTLYSLGPTDIGDIEKFYMEKLTNGGWEWVYTEAGESLITTVPAPALVIEFKKEEHKIGITAIGLGGGLIVLAGRDISGTGLAVGFIGGIAGGFDLMGPSESDIQLGAMHFSSTRVEFSHPSDWFATDQLISIFETDTAINYYPNRNRCSVHTDICFVTFSVLKGFHFDHPISIRVHPEMANLTLEEASEMRWNELKSNASALVQRYWYPEDLAQADTLESIEIRVITLGDGTPAIQRVYRWKQDDVEEFIIGTFTLFRSGDMLMEFHTDFTSQAWNEISDIVNEVIASMRIIP